MNATRTVGSVARLAAAPAPAQAVARRPLWPHTHSALTFGLLGYLGAVPTAFSYVLFFAGLRTVRAATASVVALLEAVTAALLGVVVMGERLTVPAVAGAVLLLGCVVSLSLAEPAGGGERAGAGRASSAGGGEPTDRGEPTGDATCEPVAGVRPDEPVGHGSARGL